MTSVRLFFLSAILAACPALAQTLSFQEALRAGESQSPRLSAQRYSVDAATELLGRATELPDPKLRFGVENLPVTGSDKWRFNGDFMTMRAIGVVQEFPNSDKRAARGLRSERQRDLEQASLAAQGAILRRDISLAWFDLYYALRAQGVMESLAGQFDAQAEAVAAGVARGRQGTAESYMLRGAAEQVRDRVIEQQRAVARARIALAVWVGDDANRPVGAPPEIAHLGQSPAVLLSRLPEHPQLRVLDERTQLARAETDLARSTKNPDWALQVGFSQREPAFSNMVSVMVMMDLPWQADRRQDRDIAARLSDVERVRAQYEELRRAAEADIRGWAADYDAAENRIRRFNGILLPLARDRTEAVLAAYRGGRGELGAVLEARRAGTETELTLISAEAQRARAWANLSFIYSTEGGR